MPELTDLPELGAAAARDWIERWDRQQEVYVADREDRFTALIDALEAGAGRPDPLVLDLGCGPGSLSVRLLERLPEATVIAVDADPVTLSLARTAYGDIPGLRFADADLRARDWVNDIGLQPGQKIDAAVSTTALHWLSQAELTSLYTTLAGLLRPGALFLDGDDFRVDEVSSPVLARLDRLLGEKESERRFPDGHAGRAEDWEQWWRAVSEDAVLAGAAQERLRRGVGHHSSESVRLAVHTEALSTAGFTEAGTLWQRGASRLLCAVR